MATVDETMPGSLRNSRQLPTDISSLAHPPLEDTVLHERRSLDYRVLVVTRVAMQEAFQDVPCLRCTRRIVWVRPHTAVPIWGSGMEHDRDPVTAGRRGTHLSGVHL
jgi:hypothetical protein